MRDEPSSDETSVGDLLDRWQRRDDLAFSALVDRFQGSLLRYARALIGEADAFSAADVVQEVFLKLARVPPVLPEEVRGDPRREESMLSSWLFCVTRSSAMDLVRSENRRRAREEKSATPESAPPATSAAEHGDTRRMVEAGIERLPADQRDVLVLRLLDHKSYREIAEITGRKEGTVAWLISEGLKRLAAILAPLLDLERVAAPARAARPLLGETS